MGIYVAQEISAIYLMNLITRCNHQIHDKSLKGLACTAISFFDNNPSGRIINRFSKDVTNSDGPLQFFLFDAVNTVGLVVSSIVVQLIVIPYITIVVPFYLVLQALIFCKVSWLIGKLRKKENLAKAPILSLTTSILEGLITIRTQRLESKFTSDMKEKVNHYYQCFITYQSYMRFNQLYSDLAGLLIVIVNIILIIKDQSIISASLAAYSLTASINIVSISSIATKDLLEISALMFSPQHLLEYKDLEPEKILSTKTFKITQGSISFEDISLQYQPHLPLVLHNLNFSITPGEKIGIVGRTGSGKSSILQVLCRLTEPASGTVLIDGKDYKTLGLHDLRRQISIIPQSSVLFSTSLRDNFDPLGLFHDDEIWKVLKLVGLDQLVISENGLNSPVGSEGIKFSAGQKQLVCIARAILVNNKIVLLDEATSNIDVQTDESIQKIIKSQFKDSTLIVIAHRLLTAADSDRILVMDEGKVVEFARPSDLIEKGSGHFFNLCESAGLTRFHFKN
jgi:ABC-type multidrug transport system fused ATPase/permease subunit